MAIETAADEQEIAKKQVEREIIEQAERKAGFLDRACEVHGMLSTIQAFVIYETGNIDLKSVIFFQGIILIIAALGGILTNVEPPKIEELEKAKEIYNKKRAEAGVKK